MKGGLGMNVTNKKKKNILLIALIIISTIGLAVFFTYSVKAYEITGPYSKSFQDTKNSGLRQYAAYMSYTLADAPSNYTININWGCQLNKYWKGDWEGELYESNSYFTKATYKKTIQLSGGKNKFGTKTVSYPKEEYSYSRTITARVRKTSTNKGTDIKSWQYVSIPVTVPALNSYVVAYNLNGGSGTPPANQVKWYGRTMYISNVIPVREGYTFKGWNTNANGTGVYYGSSGLYTANSGTTLYAQWELTNYPITYLYSTDWVTNRALTTSNPNPASYNISTNITLQDVNMTGYKFNGWTGGAVTTPTKNIVISPGQMGPKTFTAHYSANEYKVRFNPNASDVKRNGTKAEPYTQDFKYDKSQALLSNQFTRKNWNFAGWNTKPDGTGMGYSNYQEVKNLTSDSESTVDLYAQWSKNVIVKIEKKEGTNPLSELEKDSSGNYLIKNRRESYFIVYKADSNSKIYSYEPLTEKLFSGESPGGVDTYPIESDYVFDGWVCTTSDITLPDGRVFKKNSTDQNGNKMTTADLRTIKLSPSIIKEIGSNRKGLILKAHYKKKAAPKKCVVKYKTDSNGFIFGLSTTETILEGGSPSGKIAFPKQIGYKLRGWISTKDVEVKTGETKKTVRAGEYMTADEVKNIILSDSITVKAIFLKN